jgi:hypothetical protein
MLAVKMLVPIGALIESEQVTPALLELQPGEDAVSPKGPWTEPAARPVPVDCTKVKTIDWVFDGIILIRREFELVADPAGTVIFMVALRVPGGAAIEVVPPPVDGAGATAEPPPPPPQSTRIATAAIAAKAKLRSFICPAYRLSA